MTKLFAFLLAAVAVQHTAANTGSVMCLVMSALALLRDIITGAKNRSLKT